MSAYIVLPDGSFIRKRFDTGAIAMRYAYTNVPAPWGIQNHEQDPWGPPWGSTLALKRHASKSFDTR